MSEPVAVSAEQARRFLRKAHLLDAPASGVGAVLGHLGYVQMDPINVCGRMHEHILRNRVAGYREGDLERHLHGEPGEPRPSGERAAFEHHLPSTHILAAFPVDAWPHMGAAMEARSRRTGAWMGRLTAREREVADALLEQIGERGPSGSAAFADGRRGRRVWGSATLAKTTLQKLFFHGRLLIAGRESNRRLYDLPARVLPREVLGQARPGAEATARWLVRLRLRQHRLVALRRGELGAAEGIAQEVRVEGCRPLHCLSEDLPLLLGEPSGEPSPEPMLMAPLDPVLYDRALTRSLWDFDYTWEVYVPAPRRTRGYYALPVLCGTAFAGHVDLKADRAGGRLRVLSRRVRRGVRTQRAVGSLAAFLGLRRP